MRNGRGSGRMKLLLSWPCPPPFQGLVRRVVRLMPSTQTSRRSVFRTIAQATYSAWPAYTSTPLYDQRSLDGVEADIRTVAAVWFEHDAHESVEEFICHLPLAYVDFQPHDRYTGTTQYDMSQLTRVFLLKELHGWDHETVLVDYLQQRPALCRRLDFDAVPDQSTLWRTWHHRFTATLREPSRRALG